jgi:hypothetical protein
MKRDDMARPLIKKNAKGEPYTRPPGVEAKIDRALGQDIATLIRWARMADSGSPDFLPSECLVHLIREAVRRGDGRMANALMAPLLKRCEANVLKMVPDSAMRNAEGVRQDILSSFAIKFAEDGMDGYEGELDYFECRFNRAFRTLRIDHVRAEISRRRDVTDLPEPARKDGEFSPDEEVLSRMSRAARIKAGQEDRIYLPQVLKAVNALPPDQRRAVILCRILGYEEESTDACKRTAANICGVSGRTIRNRLSRADQQLQKFREDV